MEETSHNLGVEHSPERRHRVGSAVVITEASPDNDGVGRARFSESLASPPLRGSNLGINKIKNGKSSLTDGKGEAFVEQGQILYDHRSRTPGDGAESDDRGSVDTIQLSSQTELQERTEEGSGKANRAMSRATVTVATEVTRRRSSLGRAGRPRSVSDGGPRHGNTTITKNKLPIVRDH